MKKKFVKTVSIATLIFFGQYLNAQNFYIPPTSNQVDSMTYNKYLGLLKYSFFQDSISPGSDHKHNIFIAYDYLKAPIDTILKYVYLAIAYDPIGECETSCSPDSYTYPSLMKKYPKEWLKVCRKCDSIFAKFNRPLMDTLEKVSENDQMYRKDTNLSSLGSDSEPWRKQTELDIENLKIIEKVIKNYGYPGKRLVGSELSDVAFLVIQHAPVEKQELYLSAVEKAVKNCDLDRTNLPYLIDRIRMRKKIPQLYGTQLIWNNMKEKLELYPVEDIQSVDYRRDQMNLYPLRDYLKDNNVDFTIKKQ